MVSSGLKPSGTAPAFGPKANFLPLKGRGDSKAKQTVVMANGDVSPKTLDVILRYIGFYGVNPKPRRPLVNRRSTVSWNMK